MRYRLMRPPALQAGVSIEAIFKGDCIVIDVGVFTEEQKKLLAHIVSDLDNNAATGTLLYIMEKLLRKLGQDGIERSVGEETGLKADLEACMAALAYLKIHEVAKEH